MKHHGGLFPQQNDRGEFRWTLPSGRSYLTQPPSKITFGTALQRPDIQALNAEYSARYPYGPAYWDDEPSPSLPGDNSANMTIPPENKRPDLPRGDCESKLPGAPPKRTTDVRPNRATDAEQNSSMAEHGIPLKGARRTGPPPF